MNDDENPQGNVVFERLLIAFDTDTAIWKNCTLILWIWHNFYSLSEAGGMRPFGILISEVLNVLLKEGEYW